MWLSEHGLNAGVFDVRVSVGDQFGNSVFGQVPHQDLSKCVYFILEWILRLTGWKTLPQQADRVAKLALAQGHNSGPNLDKSLVYPRNALRDALVEELGIDYIVSIDQVHE